MRANATGSLTARGIMPRDAQQHDLTSCFTSAQAAQQWEEFILKMIVNKQGERQIARVAGPIIGRPVMFRYFPPIRTPGSQVIRPGI